MASKTVTIKGRAYTITGVIDRSQDDTSEIPAYVPMVEIKQMSDFRWELNSLMSRINNPEVYRENLGEDVDAVIAELTSWITEHMDEADDLRDGERAFLTMLIGKEAAV